MIEIKHHNESYSYFKIDDREIVKKVAKLLSPYAPNYMFHPAYRIGNWDGRIPFYKVINGHLVIPKGMIDYVEKLLKRENLEVSIEPTQYENITEEECEKFIESLKIPFKPYSYQKKCFYDSLTQGRLTNISATGSGKSLIIYLLVRYFIETNRKVMVIVPNIMLVNQIFNDFVSYGWEESEASKVIQRIGGEHKEKEIKCPGIITTWQSQYRNETDFYDVDCIIVDECQGVKGTENQLKDVILPKATKAKFRFGFTGTLPKEEIEKLCIFSALGKPHKVINAQGLIDIGLATPVKIKSIFIEYSPEESQAVAKLKDYRQEEKYVAEHSKRNKLVVGIVDKISKSGNSLLLFRKIEHGDFLLRLLVEKKTGIKDFEIIKEVTKRNISKLDLNVVYFSKTPLKPHILDHLEKVGYNTNNFKNLDDLRIFYVSGEIDSKERERIRVIMEEYRDAIIFGTIQTMSTGINIKSLKNLILGSSTKSEITIGQSIGRIMRLHHSKNEVNVYDIVDVLITKRGKENYFYKHYKERLNEYLENGYPIQELSFKI